MYRKDEIKKGRSNRKNRKDETYIQHQMRTQVNSLTLTGNEDLSQLQWDYWNNVELLIFRDKTKENKIVVLGTDDEKALIDFVSNAEIDKKNSTIKIKHDTTKENVLKNKNERLLNLISVAENYKLDKTEIEVLSDEWKENTLTNGNEKLLQITYTEKDSDGRSKTVLTVLQDAELLQMIKDLQEEIKRIDSELKDINELINKNKELADEEFKEVKQNLTDYKEEVETKLSDLKTELTTKIEKNSSDISNLDKRVTTNETNIDTNKNDISNIDKRVTTNETNINTNKTDISNIDKRVTTNETDISDLKIKVTNNSTKIEQNFKTNIDTASTILKIAENNQESIFNLDKRVTANETDIENLKNNSSGTTDLTEINNNIKELKETTETHTTEIEENKQSITTNETDIKDIRNISESNKGKIVLINENINEINELTNSLDTSRNQLEKRMLDSELNITSLTDLTNTHTTEIEKNTNRIEVLENKKSIYIYNGGLNGISEQDKEIKIDGVIQEKDNFICFRFSIGSRFFDFVKPILKGNNGNYQFNLNMINTLNNSYKSYNLEVEIIVDDNENSFKMVAYKLNSDGTIEKYNEVTPIVLNSILTY